MLKTLAAKYQSMVSKMAAKYQAKIETPHGLRTCFEARVHRDGKPDLVARFGGIPLIRDKNAVIADRITPPAPYPRRMVHGSHPAMRSGDPGKTLTHREADQPGAAG
jgi:hypothetical protein